MGCESKKASDEAAGPAAKPARWVDTSPARVAQGKAAFGACMGCHGEDGTGRVGIGPRIASETFLSAASDDFLVLNIKEGRAGTTMIPWKSSFSDDQVEAVVAYLRSLQPSEPAQLDERSLRGDAMAGGADFRAICSGCHGRHGGGYQETANGTGIGRKVFLDKASNGFLRYIIGSGKTHTKMKGFSEDNTTAVANLSPQQIDNVIAHLRQNAW